MEQIILGIDPGTRLMGYALIEVEGNKAKLITMDVLSLLKIQSHELRIKKIFDTTRQIIDTHHPDFLAIEAPFYGKNVQSMLKLGRAQGVAIAAALARDIPFCEYEPRRVKQSVTGNGAASKEQVAAMMQRLLNFREMPQHLDATDALAVAYCHFLNNFGSIPQATPKTKKKNTSWAAFISENQSRIIK